MRVISLAAGAVAVAISLFACAPETPSGGSESQVAARAAAPSHGPAAVDAARLAAADAEPGQWMSYGRNYEEQHYSPLDQINTDNIGGLGLAWFADIPLNRGQEATPLVVDGTMYVTSAWSKVFALDARTGKEKWRFDPQVPATRRSMPAATSSIAASRPGAAASSSARSTAGSIALDAATGKTVWSVRRPTRRSATRSPARRASSRARSSSATAAREMGVRGYVSAYDAETGKMRWRFYTVPGNPAGRLRERR